MSRPIKRLGFDEFNRLRTVMENLEKSWNFVVVMFISSPGKVYLFIALRVMVRTHQKQRDFFPPQSQRTDARGCDRCGIFPGGEFGPTQCG